MMSGAGLIWVEDRRWAVSGSLVASVLLHVVAAVVVFWAGMPGGSGRVASVRAMGEEMVQPIEEETLRLGMNDATTASINWLGIMRDEAVEGEAEISEVEQAAQTTVVGESAEFVDDAVEQRAEEVEQVVEEPVEVVEQVAPGVFEREEMVAAVEEMTNDVADAVGEMVGQAIEGIDALMEGAASAVVIPEKVEGGGGAPIAEVKPDPTTAATAPVPVVKEVVKEAAEGVTGAAGVLSAREVTATRIKKAIDVDPRAPNAPIVGKGLEITTVHPRYPTAVRISALPKNPIVVIFFDATGKVKRAEFLKDGRVEYSTGVVGVDEPLLNAIYQWRAKGAEIDALDPMDPKAMVEVSIKVVFREEREGSTD